jgi:predicted phosphodiesterase
MGITLIGDVHGYGNNDNRKQYLDIIGKNEYTVQIGDCDFSYEHLNHVDPEKHKVIAGNHDNHNMCYGDPHFLGRFGNHVLNGVPFFYIAGAWSIDYKYRVENESWWANEELSYDEMCRAINWYEEVKPDIVLSHEAPSVVVQTCFSVFDSNKTRNGLRVMFEIHKPKLWVFGHWHRHLDTTILGTRFVCLNELKTMEI